MRAIFMDQNTSSVVLIVGVTADMIASFHDQTCPAKLTGNSLGKHRAREACTDDEEIKHS